MLYCNGRCCHNGRRLALCGGTVTLRLYRNRFAGINIGGRDAMSIVDLLCVLGYTATIFSLGYMLGKDARKQK